MTENYWQEKLKHKINQKEEPEELNFHPTASIGFNKEQCWQFEQAVRDSIKQIREKCLAIALENNGKL